MQFTLCKHRQHADAILAILNETILTSTALYDYHPRSADSMVTWFQSKAAHDFPVIGAFTDDGELMGFASYGSFRNFPAYKYSVEHAVYVHRDHRGKGIAQALLQRLIATAHEQQLHVMIGVIDMANTTSIALHHKLGFSHAGTIRQAGFKFGQWLDVGFYQLLLETPLDPVDG